MARDKLLKSNMWRDDDFDYCDDDSKAKMINEYIEECEENGIEPEDPDTGVIYTAIGNGHNKTFTLLALHFGKKVAEFMKQREFVAWALRTLLLNTYTVAEETIMQTIELAMALCPAAFEDGSIWPKMLESVTRGYTKCNSEIAVKVIMRFVRYEVFYYSETRECDFCHVIMTVKDGETVACFVFTPTPGAYIANDTFQAMGYDVTTNSRHVSYKDDMFAMAYYVKTALLRMWKETQSDEERDAIAHLYPRRLRDGNIAEFVKMCECGIEGLPSIGAELMLEVVDNMLWPGLVECDPYRYFRTHLRDCKWL